MSEKQNPDLEINEVGNKSWVIRYNDYNKDGQLYTAQCKFELSSHEDAVIYDLEVPEEISNNGIGTSMLELAENIIKGRTEAQHLYAQIGARDGATRYVLSQKCGFNVTGTEHNETLGEVVDAHKKLK